MAMTNRFLDTLTVVTALAALGLAGGNLLRNETPAPAGSDAAPRNIPEWQELAAEGRRIGPGDAAMTILEWVDYECPACRAFHPHASALLRKYPDDVALVLRHYPLPYHRSAYHAARAAECAASQGVFHSFHDHLLDGNSLDSATLTGYAEAIGITDIPEFEACISDPLPVDRIERDILAAKAVGARGTPTVIVNGLMTVPIPDSLALERTLKSILDAQGRHP